MTLLPPSTPWTSDAIGPLLPTGCQVILILGLSVFLDWWLVILISLSVFLDWCWCQAYLCGPSAFTTTTIDLLQQVLPYTNIYLILCDCNTHLLIFGWKYCMKYNWSLSRRGWSRTTFSTSASGLKPRKRSRSTPLNKDDPHQWTNDKCQSDQI